MKISNQDTSQSNPTTAISRHLSGQTRQVGESLSSVSPRSGRPSGSTLPRRSFSASADSLFNFLSTSDFNVFSGTTSLLISHHAHFICIVVWSPRLEQLSFTDSCWSCVISAILPGRTHPPPIHIAYISSKALPETPGPFVRYS